MSLQVGQAPVYSASSPAQSASQTVATAPRIAAPAPQICTQDQCKAPASANPKAHTCENFIDQPASRSFYLNGIRTPEDSAREARDVLEGKTGEQIELLYNPTEGLVADVSEAICNLSGIDTAVATRAQAKFQAALDKGEKVKIYAHSQGAAIAADALRNIEEAYEKKGLSKAQIQAKMRQVEVVGFGGFAIKQSFPKGVEVELYKKEHDYIPKFAEGLCEIGAAIQSKEKDLWGKVGKFGQTIGGFVAFNSGQALKFLSDKPAQVSACPKKSTLDDLGAICTTMGKAIESDHDMVVKNDYIRQEFNPGYLDQFHAKTNSQNVA